MINRKHDLPILRQCKALKVHRTTIYREPKPVNQEQLDLMKVIDTIHLDEPTWGVRKVRQYLNESGDPVGRRHCDPNPFFLVQQEGFKRAFSRRREKPRFTARCPS